MDRPLPHPTKISKPFWDACNERKLIIQKCAHCHEHTFYPAYICPHCFTDALEWTEASGEATVYSVTVVERGAGEAFDADLPICVALVELAEGPVIMSDIVGAPPHSVSINDAVTVDFREVAPGTTLPVFRMK